MATTGYEIGTTSSTTDLGALTTPVDQPHGDFVEWSRTYDRADGRVAADGYPVAIWRFDRLTQAMATQLRTFCSGKSAAVYIKTRLPTGSFAKYSAVMVWPDDQMKKRNFGGRYLGIEITFRKLVAV